LENRLAEFLTGTKTGDEKPQLSVVEKLMVDQIIVIRLQLNTLNARLATDPEAWSDLDTRVLNSLGNQLRLGLKALGLGAKPNRPDKRNPRAAIDRVVAAHRAQQHG
jgi:hypothetical protein